jgi:hypothetical protein
LLRAQGNAHLLRRLQKQAGEPVFVHFIFQCRID